MTRQEFLLRDIQKSDRILEVGPYHKPIAAKKAGWNVTSIDIVTQDSLRAQAAKDPNIPPDDIAGIEEIDLLGSASNMADIARAKYGRECEFDWILSSHNIEHIPNPIRFFQQAGAVLRVGGILRLAVPDKRACFDYYRPLTEISGWLEAFHEKRDRPSIYQVFQQESLRCGFKKGKNMLGSWSLNKPAHEHLIANQRILHLYREWFGAKGGVPAHYIDTHCWTFTPASFQLLMHDAYGLQLAPFRLRECSDTQCHEFFVDLEKTACSVSVDSEAFYAARQDLLLAVTRELNSQHGTFGGQLSQRWLGITFSKVARETARVARQAKKVILGMRRLL